MPKLNDAEFVNQWHACGRSAAEMSRKTGMTERRIYERKERLNKVLDQPLVSANSLFVPDTNKRIEIEIENGVMMVGSDHHYWPDCRTTAHNAFVHLIPILKPKYTMANGDFFDGATISRHPKRGWDLLPTVADELKACKVYMGEIEKASAKIRGNKLLRTRGNHCDGRFDARLADRVPEFEGVEKMTLAEHFPKWEVCTSVFINNDTVVKHRWHNGVSRLRYNVMKSGCNYVTGHTHGLSVEEMSFYDNRTLYGVDSGMIADVTGPQFQYTEDNPTNHRSGFVVLEWQHGRLMPPDLCEVIAPGKVRFRGQTIKL